MAIRRKMMGKPLLLATGFAAAVGCGAKNPPSDVSTPTMSSGKVCVDVKPENAVVKVAGKVTKDRCTIVRSLEMNAEVEVSAPDYQTYKERVQLNGLDVELKVELESLVAPTPAPLIPPPTGNLMAPPQNKGKK